MIHKPIFYLILLNNGLDGNILNDEKFVNIFKIFKNI